MAGTRAEDLPNAIVEQIFSFLPTRDVVQICLLSKTWQDRWTTISDLRFSVSSPDDAFVDEVLRRYGRGRVRKFNLDIHSEKFRPAKIDSWVRFAIDRQVEELFLDLIIWSKAFGPIWFVNHTLSHASMLYNCSSLTRLVLRGCLFLPCESLFLPCLFGPIWSLSVEVVDDDVLQKILMGCPVLEYLTLQSQSCCDFKEIHSTSLRELVIYASVVRSCLHISTPRLLSLRVRVEHYCDIIRIVEAPSLLEVELDFDGPTELDFCLLKEMLCMLQNATRILFGAWILQVKWPLKIEDVQVSLPNCKSLTLGMPIFEFSFPAIANMLATTPNLEKLTINFTAYEWHSYIFGLDSCNVDHKTYWHIKKEFKGWARHLKNVEIFGFCSFLRGKYGEVLMLLKFLLENAFVLENMVIKFTEGSQYPKFVSLDKLHEVIRQLKCYHKASKHAAIILNYQEEEHGKWQKKEITLTRK